MASLLTRTEFREAVFARDNYRCVFCSAPAVDAHHIIERRLFPDGGYYIENGASVCQTHHLACEATTISVEQVRAKCSITKPVLPPHFYDDIVYDKWGNAIDGDRRSPGELFDDESVQKILDPKHLAQFVPYVKYPRTYHLPWSPGMNDDDRMMDDVRIFEGRKVIVMEKLDGENTTMYNDYMHARSLTSGGHESRDWIKAFHGMICYDIPEGWRINIENMYAKHSILYTNLDTYAYGFAIWNRANRILDWKTTLEWFDLLGITPCPVVYWGAYDRKVIERAFDEIKKDHKCEGYVIRVDEPFHMKDFRQMVGKYVRKDHIQTTKHWMHGQRVEPNILKPGLTGFEKTKERNL
jgi:hypothetical protein